MQTHTKRFQILLQPYLWDRLQALAQERNTSVAALIRAAVERVYFPDQSVTAPLDAVQKLAAMNLPVSDWEQMEAESVPQGTRNKYETESFH